jgi:excinuclease ABC subunit B
MAEHLTEYLSEHGVSVTYMHSDTETLDRIEIIRSLKAGEIDVLVGINLLREGLDIPDCALIAILDADKEGYLRSRTALVQTIGRAARNIEGRVILYADRITNSMKEALDETERRRKIQDEFNKEHGIVPTPIIKPTAAKPEAPVEEVPQDVSEKDVATLEKMMKEASENLMFELAAKYRDQIKKLKDL